MKVCKHGQCPRPSRARGYCGTHYQQWRVFKRTWDILNTSHRKSDEEIVQRELDRLAQQVRRREVVRPEFGPCKAPGCGLVSKIAVSQECTGHYQQRMNGKEYSDLRDYSEKQDKRAPERKCNGCQRIKNTAQGFYIRSNGTPQNQCKRCMALRNRYRTLLRQDRLDEAKQAKVEWDEYVAEGRSEALEQG